MKMKFLLTAFAMIFIATGMTNAQLAQYDSGVLPQAGAGPAADPATQGWTAYGMTNAWADAFDSGDGGWRIVDGTSSAGAFYQYDLTASDLSAMAGGWTADWTLSMDSDAINSTGGFVDDFYLPPNNGRQNNMSMWVENSSAGYRYILSFLIDGNSDLLFSDDLGATTTQLTTDGSAYDNFKNMSLGYDGVSATLTFGANDYAVATNGSATVDRVVFGAISSSGSGSAIWNELTVVPEPTTMVLLGLGGLLGLRRRR